MNLSRWPVLLAGVLFVATAAAADKPRTHFPSSRISFGTPADLNALLAGRSVGAKPGVRGLRPGGRETILLARAIHRLMPGGVAEFEQVLITPSHVAMIRTNGLVDVLRRADAEAQVKSGTTFVAQRVPVDIGAVGRSIFAEPGPNRTWFLYRQLPHALGDVASRDVHTSFSVDHENAIHPFGAQGKTVRLAIPDELFKNAREGREGAVGWNAFGDGYSTGLEVEKEVQIPSKRIRDLLH